MKITVSATGVDLDTVVLADEERSMTLGELVAMGIASHVVEQAQRTGSHDRLAELVASVSEEEVRTQVRELVAEALHAPAGQVPVTLAQMIQAEARSQITSDPDRYQGISTPLKQVVAAVVYEQLHDEVTGLVQQARDTIKTQTREEISKIVRRQFL